MTKLVHPLKKVAYETLKKLRGNNNDYNALIEKCRTDFASFYRLTFRLLNPGVELHDGWHIDCLSEHVTALIQGQMKTLIINIPPREGKSGAGSVALPAYLLGQNPSEKVMCASYAASLATSLSVQCRRVLESEDYSRVFPRTLLAPDQNEKAKYETTAYGMRLAVSVGGSITGFGGDWKILDDPHDPKGAASTAELEAAIAWYRETWSSRYNDPAKVCELIIMQRLAMNDLAAHVLSTNKKAHLLKLVRKVTVPVQITFPISGRVVERPVGDILNPTRYTDEILEDLLLKTGSYAYEAQQQQEPTPRGGDRIKEVWFPRYKHLPVKFQRVVQSWDTASKEAEINNPSGCLTMGLSQDRWYLINYWQERKNFPGLLRSVVTLAEAHYPHSIIVEDKSTGSSILQAFKDRETNLPKLPVKAFDPSGKGSKVERLDAVTNFLEAGYIYLPDEALGLPWLGQFTRNIFAFPNPEFWEPIDCLSQFLLVEFRDAQKHKFNFTIGSLTKEARTQ